MAIIEPESTVTHAWASKDSTRINFISVAPSSDPFFKKVVFNSEYIPPHINDENSTVITKLSTYAVQAMKLTTFINHLQRAVQSYIGRVILARKTIFRKIDRFCEILHDHGVFFGVEEEDAVMIDLEGSRKVTTELGAMALIRMFSCGLSRQDSNAEQPEDHFAENAANLLVKGLTPAIEQYIGQDMTIRITSQWSEALGDVFEEAFDLIQNHIIPVLDLIIHDLEVLRGKIQRQFV